MSYYKHGMKNTPTWISWRAMKARCLNKKDPFYHAYGGRGIKICERWLTFTNFFSDMGLRPKNTSLDRIDCDGNYEPGNCRWADKYVQAKNKREIPRHNEQMTNVRSEVIKNFNGNLNLAAKHLGINYSTLWAFVIRRGLKSIIGKAPKGRKPNMAEIRNMVHLKDSGKTYKEIGEEYGVTANAIFIRVKRFRGTNDISTGTQEWKKI